MAERFQRYMKTTLKAMKNGQYWMGALPLILLGMNTAPEGDLATYSAELVFGFPPTVAGDFIPAPRR